MLSSTQQQLQQVMPQLGQPQPQPKLVPHMSSYNGQSPSPIAYMAEIKAEQLPGYELDTTRNCPSAASSCNTATYHFPVSPSASSCSTIDSIAPMQQQQQLQQLPHLTQQDEQLLQLLNQETVNLTFSINNASSNWTTSTTFNGGSLTPTNITYSNNNNINNNNNIVFNATCQTFPPIQQQIQLQSPPTLTNLEQDLTQQQQPEENPSFSDLILMNYQTTDDIDIDIIRDLQATLI
ncbi:GH10079 [Drosophila grimshawi]|uniref:GH10079 n=1 Tax=Drosophila grimshawi TaxID=7222 RepID=B4JD19_DROGR|nr:GH10079 [Drosophila grimshawi]